MKDIVATVSIILAYAEFGASEINWYWSNGEIVKYKDGKRIKE